MKLRHLSTISILIVLLVSGCIQEQNQQENPTETQTLNCPSSCNDKNPCTNDFCSEQTNFKCMHDEIIPCCGNKICEDGENFLICNDCPKAKTTTIKPSELALDLKDLPDNYMIKENRPVSKSEVNMSEAPNISKELMDWDEGYLASFIKEDSFNAIGQRIYIYSSTENIAKTDFSQAVFLMEENSLNTYEEIPCDIGDKCTSWKITITTNDRGDKATVYTLLFIKMNVYEEIFVFHLDYELLVDLAKKAEAKIK